MLSKFSEQHKQSAVNAIGQWLMVVLVPHELWCVQAGAAVCAGVQVGKQGVLWVRTGQPACMVTFGTKPRNSKPQEPWSEKAAFPGLGGASPSAPGNRKRKGFHNKPRSTL